MKQVHIIHCYEAEVGDSGKKEIVNKIETRKIKQPLSLSEMQSIVEGSIECYPASLPKMISKLPDSRKITEMWINEDGRFTKPINHLATQIAYEVFGADKVTGRIPDTNQIVLSVHGTVFINDNWRVS